MKQVSVKVPARSIGLDLGDDSSSYCILDGRAQVVREGSIETSRRGLDELMVGQPACRIVLEASRQSHWTSKHLRSLGHEVIVINPRRLQLISESVCKTDRNDARLLARVGRLDVGILQPVHEKSDESLASRMLLRGRSQLVRTRTRIITLVRGSLKVFGIKVPTCSTEVFDDRARRLIPKLLRPALDPLLETLADLKQHIECYDHEIARTSDKRFPQTALFQQIHGVGPLVALSFITAIEDPKRFKSSRTVGAYLGLTPRSYQSGKSDPRLRITKQGDGMLRSLLVTAATHILRRSAPDCDLKRYGKRVSRGGTPRDRGRARIAVARKLACLMHRLWLTGEVYQPLRTTQPA